MSALLRAGVTACLILAGATLVASAHEKPGVVGTWYQRERHGAEIFYKEMTLFADGRYCAFTLATGWDEPFSQTIGVWRQDDGYLSYRAERSTDPDELFSGEDMASLLGPVLSVTRQRLRLGSLSPHMPDPSEYHRREPMRGDSVCRFAGVRAAR